MKADIASKNTSWLKSASSASFIGSWDSIGKVWHNRFVLELFRELKESEGLHLTGIEVQQSRRKHFSSFLERYLTGRIRQQYIDSDRLANELLDKNGIFKWRF